MAKKLIFSADALTLTLSGFHRIAALKKAVILDWRQIQSVRIDTFQKPFWMLHMPGLNIPYPGIFEGSFTYRNKWYFLSIESNLPKLIIETKAAHRYDYVIVDLPDVEPIAEEISKRILSI